MTTFTKTITAGNGSTITLERVAHTPADATALRAQGWAEQSPAQQPAPTPKTK